MAVKLDKLNSPGALVGQLEITSDNNTQERHEFSFSQTALIINIFSFAATQTAQSTSIQKQLAELEAFSKGRIGVYAINTANNTHLGWIRLRIKLPIQLKVFKEVFSNHKEQIN